MKVFVDTSAFLSLLNKEESNAQTAWEIWQQLGAKKAEITTTNYVVIESTALIQNRLGLDAVRDFQKLFVPLISLIWVDATLHKIGMSFMLAANRRQLSLVDCVSFATMRELNIEHYFAFDQHFDEQGFTKITV
ncbi:MAG: type II toxin-antitoxin system VapC family toxin [Anaerolineae bacterium]|nr:type II toxin-antitoxin system VapC family toxin [Anaerolineae bacterium]